MSRGPGKWQRVVLEALNLSPAWYVRTLLPQRFTRSEYVALLRAVNQLESTGRVEVDRYLCWATKPGKLVVRVPGSTAPPESLSKC